MFRNAVLHAKPVIPIVLLGLGATRESNNRTSLYPRGKPLCHAESHFKLLFTDDFYLIESFNYNNTNIYFRPIQEMVLVDSCCRFFTLSVGALLVGIFIVVSSSLII